MASIVAQKFTRKVNTESRHRMPEDDFQHQFGLPSISVSQNQPETFVSHLSVVGHSSPWLDGSKVGPGLSTAVNSWVCWPLRCGCNWFTSSWRAGSSDAFHPHLGYIMLYSSSARILFVLLVVLSCCSLTHWPPSTVHWGIGPSTGWTADPRECDGITSCLQMISLRFMDIRMRRCSRVIWTTLLSGHPQGL